MKKIDVVVDSTPLGSVYNQETSAFTIAAGSHRLKVKSGWYGSKDLTFPILENETKSLSVDVFKYGNLIISSLAVTLALHFIASFFFGIKFLIWLSIPAVLIILYYLTLGRNDYLVITEIK